MSLNTYNDVGINTINMPPIIYCDKSVNTNTEILEIKDIGKSIHNLRDEVKKSFLDPQQNKNTLDTIEKMRESAVNRLSLENTSFASTLDPNQRLNQVLNSDISPNTAAPAIDQILLDIVIQESVNTNIQDTLPEIGSASANIIREIISDHSRVPETLPFTSDYSLYDIYPFSDDLFPAPSEAQLY